MVVTIANGAQPYTVEAELWGERPDEKEGTRWRYFRRCTAPTAAEAAEVSRLPRIVLMQADEVARPFHHDGWIYEEKYDGWRKRPEDAASTPPIYMGFDCLYLEGRDPRSLSLRERRGRLEEIVENDHALIFPARRLANNGLEAWAQAVKAGYEGFVAKDEASPYRGGRTLSWLKVKQRDYRIAERGCDASKNSR